MPDPDDLANRVGSLETQVAQIREQLARTATDASAARMLAAGADRDVSEVRAELRAHTGALNALREDQISLRDTLRGEIDELRQETRRGFALVHAGTARIVTLIEGLAGS